MEAVKLVEALERSPAVRRLLWAFVLFLWLWCAPALITALAHWR